MKSSSSFPSQSSLKMCRQNSCQIRYQNIFIDKLVKIADVRYDSTCLISEGYTLPNTVNLIFCFLIPVLKIRPLSLKTHFPHFFSNRYVTYKSRPPTKVFDVILFDCTLIKSFWYYASSQKIMTHSLQKFNSYCALKKRTIRYVTSDTLRQIRYWNMRALCA